MSSDETDSENTAQYKVFLKPWRHPRVQEWLRIIDRLYLINRQNNRQGSMPRPRLATEIVSDSKEYVTHLPKNAYEPVWLASLGVVERGQLMDTEVEYDFSFEPEVMTCVHLSSSPLRELTGRL